MKETKEACKTCRYFRQHYTVLCGGYLPVDCGHCVHPRLKDRRPETPACQRWSRHPEPKA